MKTTSEIRGTKELPPSSPVTEKAQGKETPGMRAEPETEAGEKKAENVKPQGEPERVAPHAQEKEGVSEEEQAEKDGPEDCLIPEGEGGL